MFDLASKHEWSHKLQNYRAISDWLPKEKICECIGFALIRSVIGPENLRHFLNQSDAKLTPFTTCIFRAWGSSVLFILSSHWLLEVFSCLLIPRCDHFGLILRHSIENRYNRQCQVTEEQT